MTGVDGGADRTATRDPQPMLVTPPGSEEPWWTVRDREEELVAIARQIKADEASGEAVPSSHTAVVFKRPLPYLYLAAEVFGAAGIPYEAFDALPLAAEPTVAALDLVLDAVAANFTRSTLIALLRSPHFVFTVDGAAVTRDMTSALDRTLSHARYLGDPARLDDLPLVPGATGGAARDAGAAAAGRAAARFGAHVARVARVLDITIAAARGYGSAGRPRAPRARSPVRTCSRLSRRCMLAHDDPEWTIRELALAVRRSIEEQTFVPAPTVDGGVHLLDDQAARYGDVRRRGDRRSDRSRLARAAAPEHLLSAALLKSLGWPSEQDRRAAADAQIPRSARIRRAPNAVVSRSRSTRTPSSRGRCSSTRSRALA